MKEKFMQKKKKYMKSQSKKDLFIDKIHQFEGQKATRKTD